MGNFEQKIDIMCGGGGPAQSQVCANDLLNVFPLLDIQGRIKKARNLEFTFDMFNQIVERHLKKKLGKDILGHLIALKLFEAEWRSGTLYVTITGKSTPEEHFLRCRRLKSQMQGGGEIPTADLPARPLGPSYKPAKVLLEEKRSLFQNSSAIGMEKLVVPKVKRKGIEGILENIRAREEHRKSLRLFQNPVEEESYWRSKRLPDLARAVRGVFKSATKKCLTEGQIVDSLKLQEQYNFSERSMMSRDYQELVKSTNGWISEYKIGGEIVYKIDESENVNKIVEILKLETVRL